MSVQARKAVVAQFTGTACAPMNARQVMDPPQPACSESRGGRDAARSFPGPHIIPSTLPLHHRRISSDRTRDCLLQAIRASLLGERDVAPEAPWLSAKKVSLIYVLEHAITFLIPHPLPSATLSLPCGMSSLEREYAGPRRA